MVEINKVKAILIGDANVGKSNIFSRIASNRFEECSPPTLGAAFHIVYMTINSTKISIELWDTAGQERYYSLTESYSRGAKIVIFVYDITNRQSFDALKEWYCRLNYSNSKQIFAVFANKEDLVENEEVPLQEAQKFAQDIKAIFRKTSAKENIGIREGLEELISLYLNSNGLHKKGDSGIKVNTYKKNSKKNCC